MSSANGTRFVNSIPTDPNLIDEGNVLPTIPTISIDPANVSPQAMASANFAFNGSLYVPNRANASGDLMVDANGSQVSIESSDGPSSDAFGRYRVTEPFTLFDSKLVYDKAPEYWDELLEAGTGITSTYSTNTSSVTLQSTLNTAGTFTRQTYMRFNYQPGKSHVIFMTGVLDNSGGGTGVQRRIGFFDDNNGLFFEDNEGTVNIVKRTDTSGSPVDTSVTQASWNVDPMDGTGPSGITVDWTKTQIFVIDFEWLGVGRVRFGLNIDGKTYYTHQFLHANNLDVVYMSQPCLPLRYQIVTTGSSPASSLNCICSTVISESGSNQLGQLRSNSTNITEINANSTSNSYVICGLRLKSAYVGTTMRIEKFSLLNGSGGNFLYRWVFNPTVANAVSWTGETDSAAEFAVGNAGNPSNSTTTGGIVIDSGYVAGGGGSGSGSAAFAGFDINRAVYLGESIAGVRDELYLVVQPLSNNADIFGSITWRELT